MSRNTYDVIIVGGGVIGCSVAYYLASGDKTLSIAVVERDPTYTRASSALSVANIRIQFSLEENIRASMYAVEVLEHFDEQMAVDGVPPGISYRREGNLFLASQDQREAAQKAMALQKKLGCQVQWFSPEEINRRFPLFDANGMAGGTYCAGDGHIDAYSMLMGYKNKTRSLGVTFITDEVVKIETGPSGVSGVVLAKNSPLASPVVINCTGAWAGQTANTLGVKLPVEPVRRQVYALDTAIKPKGPLPLTVLPTGLYFRPETGGQVLLSKSMEDDPVGFDFTWHEQRFNDILWHELAGFVPQFDRLKLVRGWAGLYAENTFDENAIVGEWPDCKGFYLANGFSGHGLQQAPAVGRYLSELIRGKTPTLDLSIFKPDRILENKPLKEKGIV
ncbi:MAG: FAD-binding oxidoreductase [bacterium]|nr:FAD-binding oxidoreductase [bacterium]